MKQVLLGLLAETFIHPGAGQTGGAIDLPVAREAATDYPYIAGSSLKGALLDAAKQRGMEKDKQESLFGKQDQAGGLLVSDARLLLLPVRSLISAYRWVTCPHLLERLARDMKRSGIGSAAEHPPDVDKGSYLGNSGKGNAKLYLEERSFEPTASDDSQPSAPLNGWIQVIGGLMGDATARGRLPEQLVVLHGDDFAWFAAFGLAVQARNALDDQKKSQSLWYEETLSPDTLMYSVLAERNAETNCIQTLVEKLECRPYLQVGANETIGQGWFNVTWQGHENDQSKS